MRSTWLSRDAAWSPARRSLPRAHAMVHVEHGEVVYSEATSKNSGRRGRIDQVAVKKMEVPKVIMAVKVQLAHLRPHVECNEML